VVQSVFTTCPPLFCANYIGPRKLATFPQALHSSLTYLHFAASLLFGQLGSTLLLVYCGLIDIKNSYRFVTTSLRHVKHDGYASKPRCPIVLCNTNATILVSESRTVPLGLKSHHGYPVPRWSIFKLSGRSTEMNEDQRWEPITTQQHQCHSLLPLNA